MNWHQLSYQKRFWVLCGIICLSCLVAWVLSIGRTVSLYSENQRMKYRLQKASDAPERIVRLEAQLEQMAYSFTSESTNVQEAVLNHLGQIANKENVKLESFKKGASFDLEGLAVQTLEVTLSGTYLHLVKSLHVLEQNLENAKIMSARYRLVEDKSTKQERLCLDLYIQSIVLE